MMLGPYALQLERLPRCGAVKLALWLGVAQVAGLTPSTIGMDQVAAIGVHDRSTRELQKHLTLALRKDGMLDRVLVRYL